MTPESIAALIGKRVSITFRQKGAGTRSGRLDAFDGKRLTLTCGAQVLTVWLSELRLVTCLEHAEVLREEMGG